jgi:F-type H+-transporting ATPase subunit a
MLIIIELISHTIRTLSLAVRLFANMFAGHVLIYILSSTILLAIANLWIPVFGGLLLNIIYLVIYSLETFIAILQAYVFTALVGIYFTEAMDH